MEEPGRLQSMGSLRVGRDTFTFHFHTMEKAMATHSSVLAWRIPGTAEPGGLSSLGSHRVGHDWSDLAAWQNIILQGYWLCCWFSSFIHSASVCRVTIICESQDSRFWLDNSRKNTYFLLCKYVNYYLTKMPFKKTNLLQSIDLSLRMFVLKTQFY